MYIDNGESEVYFCNYSESILTKENCLKMQFFVHHISL